MNIERIKNVLIDDSLDAYEIELHQAAVRGE